MHIGTAPPGSPVVGDLWLDTSGGDFKLKALTAPGIWTVLQDLSPGGKIDPTFTQIATTTFTGAVDVTQPYAAPAQAPAVGSFGVVATAGTADATWAAVGISGALEAGDTLIWDGTRFHAVEHSINLHPTIERVTATAGQTAWKLAATPAHSLEIELNGTMLIPTTDWTRVADTVTFATRLEAGDELVARYF